MAKEVGLKHLSCLLPEEKKNTLPSKRTVILTDVPEPAVIYLAWTQHNMATRFSAGCRGCSRLQISILGPSAEAAFRTTWLLARYELNN